MRSIAAVVAVALAGLTVSGCASKKYVGREVGAVNEKVEGLSAEVEKTQQRVRDNEGRIAQVGKVAEGAQKSAADAMSRAEAAERAASGKLLYTVTLSSDKVRFPFEASQLSDEARAAIDEALEPIVEENRGVFIEIEGHTDASGSEAVNKRLGEQRATAVRDYLYERHKVALSRMAVISLGESQPVADNKTRAGRAQNRRVVIRVLE